ncbi:hypothetical protein FHR72_004684 [Mycolicibacterium iranicum]|uniref:Uncharacterized protein n=1 Tax=Mycolicibacterium iranicum TaxID=912594 RepID=A0A839QC30_MYCIR|nr:hypothetical protein [Mycolicibacterium iranicum]MBB2993177.1 hypothetical protein [Mycolicibacterium iranicum]
MAYEYNALLARLNGFHVQSVHFNGGYLQFAFTSLSSPDLPVLTCEVLPTIETANGPLTDGQPGYTDAIRSLIGHHVVATRENAAGGLQVHFAEATVTVRPPADSLHGPVIAMLSDFGDGSSMTWRPGGAAFEYLSQHGAHRHGIAGDRRCP